MNLKPLIDIIKKEQHVHEKLLQTKKQERRFMVGVNPNKLLQNTEVLHDLVEEAQQLEQKRQEITHQLAHELGIEEDQPTLKDLILHLPAANRPELEEPGNALRQTVNELKEANKINAEMLNQSVKTLNWEISQIIKTEESGVYTSSGKKGSRPVPRAGLNVRV